MEAGFYADFCRRGGCGVVEKTGTPIVSKPRFLREMRERQSFCAPQLCFVDEVAHSNEIFGPVLFLATAQPNIQAARRHETWFERRSLRVHGRSVWPCKKRRGESFSLSPTKAGQLEIEPQAELNPACTVRVTVGGYQLRSDDAKARFLTNIQRRVGEVRVVEDIEEVRRDTH